MAAKLSVRRFWPLVLIALSLALSLFFVIFLRHLPMLVSAQNLRSGGTGFMSAPAATHNQQKAMLAVAAQDFDQPGAGASYAAGMHVSGAPGPERLAGGISGQGHFLRLAFADPIPNQSSIALEQVAPGAFDQVVVDFDFRITPGSGRADGLGFALLSTAHFDGAGAVEPQAPLYAGEEANFAASVGIGFDIHQATGERSELNNNHLSVHFDGAVVQEVDAAPFDLAAGEWLHARVVLQAAAGAISVILSQCSSAPVTMVDQLVIPGFTPYEGRPYFIARSGGESADHDLDNIYLQFLSQAEQPIEVASPCGTSLDTYQNFDQPGTGTPYLLGKHLPAPSPDASQIDGGPTGMGQMLRLSYGNGAHSHNSIAFERTSTGAFEQVIADFSFRIGPGTGRADGLGFALLNTAHYGDTGAVAPLAVAEEPDFAGSLGVGFDIHQSNTNHLEVNDNHLSIHYDGQLLQEVDVRNTLDLAEGEWIHARIIMRLDAAHADLSVSLTQCGQPARTVIDRLKVPGLAPYEGRAYFAARSGGLTADHEIDDVRVQFLNGEPNIISFATGCYEVFETDGEALLTVMRTGKLDAAATVNYATVGKDAAEGVDFVTTSGMLTFQAGESSKTIRAPILDDAVDNERAESFAVLLSGVQGGAILGGPPAAKVTIIDDELARREGYWHDLIPSQVVPIHMMVLPTGQVMYWDRHDHTLGWDGNPRLFDPATDQITVTATISYDIFCSGYAFLENGHLLVAGGHLTGTFGEDKMSIYDPFNDVWMPQPKMNAGRWYPTAVTLSNGDVLVMGGTFDLNGQSAVNTIPQVWETANRGWRTLTGAKHDSQPDNPAYFPTGAYYPDHPDYYPFLYVMPNDQVFNAGPQRMARYLSTAGLGHWSDLAASLLEYRDYGSSVLYGDGKVLITGGNPRDPHVDTDPTILPSASTEVIDLNDESPAWRQVGAMTYGRRHLNATLLPDGSVLANGGSSAAGFDVEAGAVLHAELWDPVTEKWTVMAAQHRYRGYHSTAVLLPDGRVLSGGGGHPNPLRGAQHNLEIYSPPYLFKGARPEILNAPQQVTYGQGFTVETPNATEIANVNWVRLSAVTHAFNQSQRINRLPFSSQPGQLTVQAPADAAFAPPGHYMLFILDQEGVPSVASIIELQPDRATPVPTDTPTETATPVPPVTVTVTPTETVTPTPSDTPATVTVTPTETVTPTPSDTPVTVTVTPTETVTPIPIDTPSITERTAHLPLILGELWPTQ